MPISDSVIRKAFDVPRVCKLHINTNQPATSNVTTFTGLIIPANVLPHSLRGVFEVVPYDNSKRYVTYTAKNSKSEFIDDIYNELSDFGVLKHANAVINRGMDFHKFYRYLAFSYDESIDREYLEDINEDICADEIFYRGYHGYLYNLDDTSLLMKIQGCTIFDFGANTYYS